MTPEGGRPGAAGTVAPARLDPPPSDPLIERLFPPVPRGVHWGLERVEAALRETGDPHLSYDTLHVGGTNGKGSVASTWASVLRRAGAPAGLYTSPHLCSFRERIQVDGRPVGEDELLAAAVALREPMVRHRLTFFEAATLLAFHVFARRGAAVVAVEVGLGGRLDATNVVRPLVSVVTNVAMDHADYLGDTLPAIAREKAGIVKVGVPFVTGESDPALVELFREVATARGAPFDAVDPARDVRHVETAADHTGFTLRTETWGELRLRTPLPGVHQALNAAVAVRGLERLPPELRPGVDAVVEGVAGVLWPGRLQTERRDGVTWVFDVAHNTAGVQALAAALEVLALPRPLVLLVGILGDKDWRAMLPPLFERADRALLTQPPSAPPERRWDPVEAARAVGWPGRVEIEEDFGRALERAREGAAGGTVVVSGSHHTVGDALRALGVEPFGG